MHELLTIWQFAFVLIDRDFQQIILDTLAVVFREWITWNAWTSSIGI